MALLFSLRECRHITAVSLPIFVAQLSQIGMNFVDTVMSGHYSARVLAAVAVAGSVWAPVVLLAIGCLLALPGLSAQYIGARRPELSAHLLRQGILLAMLMSLALAGVLLVCSYQLSHFGLDEELAPIAGAYLRALLPGLPGLLLFICLRSFLEGFARTRPAMIIGLASLCANVPCNYIFIYGRFGMPELGAAGCGVATSICYWIMALSMFAYINHDRQLKKLSPFSSSLTLGPKIDIPLILRVLRIGSPNALALCLECSLFACTALLLAPLGTTVVAGHQITMSYANIVFTIPLSLSMTATILVGQYIGAGQLQHARASAHTILLVGLGFSCLSIAFTLCLRAPITALYSNDTQVTALACTLLLYCAAYQIVDTLQSISCGILRGYNDTRAISIACLLSHGAIGLPLCFILGRTDLVVPAMGAQGFWLGYIFALSINAVIYLVRVHLLHGKSRASIREKISR